MITSVYSFRPYDGDAPKLKIGADGKPEFRDGKLVYVKADGTDDLIDPSEIFTARSTITARNGEAKSHREAAERAVADLKKFEGIDPDKARAALDIVSKLDQKKLLDAGEVDKVRNEIKASFDGQISERDTTIKTQGERINQMIVDGVFSRSKFVTEKLSIPADIAQATFSRFLVVDKDGKVTAKNAHGETIYSKKPELSGQPADVEEALEQLVTNYPNKAAILKGANAQGSGNAGGGGNQSGGTTMTRAQFDALPPAEKPVKAAEQRAGKLTITD